MNLKRLKHAIGVAECGSFTVAASRLGISQPALSRSIQVLEEELGLLIFLREGSQVIPTEAGRDLLASARSLINHANNLQAHAMQLARGEAGKVRIGLGPMFNALIEPLIAACWNPHQSIDVQFHVLPVERLVARLLAEELDFFVADGRAAMGNTSIDVQAIGSVPVGYYVRNGHPLAQKRSVKPTDLEHFPRANPNLPSIPLENSDSIRALNDIAAGRLGCDDVSILVRFVLSNDAVLLSAEPAIRDDLRSGRLVRLDVPDLAEWNARIVLARLKDRAPTELTLRLAGALTSLLKQKWIDA